MSQKDGKVLLNGVRVVRDAVPTAEQRAMVDVIRGIAEAAPFFVPETRWGRPMSVRMTSAGTYGWISDRSGYRYDRTHPSGIRWPPIPDRLTALWCRLTGLERTPDCCLVNYYGEGARMGLHQDRDEADFGWPVLSLSLGDDGLFRVGGTERRDPTQSIWLSSGDVVILDGPTRLAFHGVDRIRFGSSRLLEGGGRLNLTFRVVD